MSVQAKTERCAQCISLPELAELTKAEIEQTEQAARKYTPASQASCTEFYNQVRSLESTVISSYKIACYLAKRTADLSEICALWKVVSTICDSVLTAMRELKKSRPDCGTEQLYNLALDYKNAAFERYQHNLEAQQWETTETPPGLFPEIA